MPIFKNICERLPLNFKDNFYIKFDFYNLKRMICLLAVGWALFFSIAIIHVINLLLNDVICIYFSVFFYPIAFIANLIKVQK